MLNVDDVPIDDSQFWSSNNKLVHFRLHINEFDDELGRQGKIWAVDVSDDNDRHYFVVRQVLIMGVRLVTIGPNREQPRAYLSGDAIVEKWDDLILLKGFGS